jgi:hypothetical protein
MKVKDDEENFDEAEAQAYRCWTETKVLVIPFISSFGITIPLDSFGNHNPFQ